MMPKPEQMTAEPDEPPHAPANGNPRQSFHTPPQIPAPRRRYLQRKYQVERLVACALLLPASPLILVVCLLVKLTSKGPVFYRQVRLGHQRKAYEILKIRTMYIDAEADGVARWCTKNDPRITPLGRVLRKLHLDELPQLVNVVRGEMVLVGPRPERPQISERLAAQIDGYYDRLRVKPGITGLAQINLPPDETLEDARRKQLLDLRYIEEANAWLDFRMVLATALRMCGISGARVTKMMRLCRRSLLNEAAAESSLEVATDVYLALDKALPVSLATPCEDERCLDDHDTNRSAFVVPRQPR